MSDTLQCFQLKVLKEVRVLLQPGAGCNPGSVCDQPPCSCSVIGAAPLVMQFDIRALLSLEDEIDEAASFAFMQFVAAEEAVEVPLLPEDIRSNREDIFDFSCRFALSYS